MSFVMDPLTSYDLKSLRSCAHCHAQFWFPQPGCAGGENVVAARGTLAPNPAGAKRFAPPACTCKACEAKINAAYELPAAL